MDAKDILGLPKSGPVGENKRVRAPKDVPKKPATVSREVYALTGGLPPIISSIDFKQRQVPTKKITWQWLPFTSSARSDSLQLYHWTRLADGVAPSGDYEFAKCNTSVEILKYTDDEYNKHLADPNWTRQETDHLFELCQQFDLRFIVIADRFSSERSVEELKQRYYSVSKAIILSRAVKPEDVIDHPLVKDPYNFNYEVDRKRALGLLLSQTRQQDQEDEEVLAEAKRITEARLAAKAAEQAELQLVVSGTIDAAAQAVAPDASAATTPNIPLAPRGHRVFLRGASHGQVITTIVNTAGVKIAKRVEQFIDELGVRAEPRVPTEAICREHLELRKEVLILLNLQKQWRDSDFTEGPATPKVGRPFRGADGPRVSVGASGERVGKRDHKRKAPARFAETPPSPPQQKRARKLKSAD